jgi:hypothetical protein
VWPFFHNYEFEVYIYLLKTLLYLQNPLENIDEEILVPDNETREMGENLLDPELAHVIVDEEVDFDQFGAPPPDLPVVDDLDNKQRDGIGSPNGEKGASGSTEVMEPEDEITDLDADTGLEQGESSFYGNSVTTAILRTLVVYVEEVLCGFW